ncbi:MAG: hypothetical protein GY801_51790 [bacterium]|nr:hypothetical protein [bacterium]
MVQHNRIDAKHCYVVKGREAEERKVRTGDFNDDFILIEEGLQEGEQIYLHDPATLLLK